jgi:hypothetical protein
MLSGLPVSSTLGSDELLGRFLSASGRQQRSLVAAIEARAAELIPLITVRLAEMDPRGDSWSAGFLVQLLLQGASDEQLRDFWQRHPQGWLEAKSCVGLDYTSLQRHLIDQQFEAADRLTSEHLRQLAGSEALRRGYVYFSEVASMPAKDLESLDRLWVVYSRGRFGFSVQGRLLLACGGQWDRLWPRLGWKQEGVWTRYPGSFHWTLEAPEGHMPLINQLRGVRLMDALLSHPGLAPRWQRQQEPVGG